jgi:hypothetical protein
MARNQDNVQIIANISTKCVAIFSVMFDIAISHNHRIGKLLASLVLPDRGSNPRSTTLEGSTLTITPPHCQNTLRIKYIYKKKMHNVVDIES